MKGLKWARWFVRPDPVLASPAHLNVRLDVRAIPGFPPGLRALFVTDVHLRPSMDPDALADVLIAAAPDLLLLGGDFADTRDQALRLFEAFRRVDAPLGCYAVPGNNDVEAFKTLDALKAALSDVGCTLLVNRSVQLNGLTVGGLDEYKFGAPDGAHLFDGRSGYRILLSHYPVLRRDVRADLMLSGHTHGGQFNFCGVTPYTIGFERIGCADRAVAFVSGLHRVGQMRLLVSKGIGMSRIPLRVGVRSEIHLLKAGLGDDRNPSGRGEAI